LFPNGVIVLLFVPNPCVDGFFSPFASVIITAPLSRLICLH
jgi:hypothetical protein